MVGRHFREQISNEIGQRLERVRFKMVSPELLRMYPFFGLLNQDQYREIAMISQEVFFAAGEEIFQEGHIIKALYLLVDGNIDLHLSLLHPLGTEILVGEINPGEPFGISSLIYPYLSTSGVRAYKNSRAIKIDATHLLHVSFSRSGRGLRRTWLWRH